MSQTITVDITPNGNRMPTLHYAQGNVGQVFQINIGSSFGDDIPSNPTVKIQATKPSGFGFNVTADSVVDNVATFTTTEAMTDESGRFMAQLLVTDGTVTLFTANFAMEGEENTHPEGTTDGQSEQAIPIITLLVERVEAAAESIHNLSVDADTLAYNENATAVYDGTTNTITFGIPRGGALSVTDPSSDGNIVMTFV